MRSPTLVIAAALLAGVLLPVPAAAGGAKSPAPAQPQTGSGASSLQLSGAATITCPDSVKLLLDLPPGWIGESPFFRRDFTRIALVQPTKTAVYCYYENLPVSSLGPIIHRAAPPGTVCEIEGDKKAVCKPVPRRNP